MKKNFAWVGSSVVAAAFAVGVVDIEAAVAVPFPSSKILNEIAKYGDGSTIRRSYPCKINILIPDNVPSKDANNSFSVSVGDAGNSYSFSIKNGSSFSGRKGNRFKASTPGDKIRIVELAGGLQGRYLYGGQYVYGRTVLEWQYGGATYEIWLSNGKLKDAISIANSAIRGGIRNPKPGQNPAIVNDNPSEVPTQANINRIPDASHAEAVEEYPVEDTTIATRSDTTSDEIPDASQPEIAAPLPKTAGPARPPSPQDIALLDRTIRDQKPKPRVADRTHMKPFTNNLLKPFIGAWTSADNQQYFVYPGKGRKTCIIVENGSTQNLQFGIAVGNATGTDMNVGTGRMFKTKNDGVLALRTPDSDRLVPLYAAAITTDLTDGNREAMKDNGCMTGFPGLPAGGAIASNPIKAGPSITTKTDRTQAVKTYKDFSQFCKINSIGCLNVSQAAEVATRLSYMPTFKEQRDELDRILRERVKLLGESVIEQPEINKLSGINEPTEAGGRILIGTVRSTKNGKKKMHSILSFRGTNSGSNILEGLYNAMSDANGRQVGNTDFHPGFKNFADGVFSGEKSNTTINLKQYTKIFASMIKKYNDGKNDQFDLLITGHSLGGAAAEIYATKIIDQLREMGLNNSKNIHVVTFGAPPSLTYDHARKYFDTDAIRVKAEGDAILDLTDNGSLKDALEILDAAPIASKTKTPATVTTLLKSSPVGMPLILVGDFISKALDAGVRGKSQATTREFRQGNYSSFAKTTIVGSYSTKMEEIMLDLQRNQQSEEKIREKRLQRLEEGVDWHVNGYKQYYIDSPLQGIKKALEQAD